MVLRESGRRDEEAGHGAMRGGRHDRCRGAPGGQSAEHCGDGRFLLPQCPGPRSRSAPLPHLPMAPLPSVQAQQAVRARASHHKCSPSSSHSKARSTPVSHSSFWRSEGGVLYKEKILFSDFNRTRNKLAKFGKKKKKNSCCS